MNNQILKAACSLMLMRRTPIFLVRGCFMGPNSFFNFSHEGMTLENLEMSGDKWLFVFDRGVVISPTITDGYAYIYPGGKMTGGEISGNAELSFQQGGGEAIDVVLKGNCYIEVSSGTLTRATSQNILRPQKTVISVTGTGVANNCVINEGNIVVEYGGILNDCTVNWVYDVPTIIVGDGGVANRSILHSRQEIQSGGVANHSHIFSNREIVRSGGTSNYATIENGGGIDVYSGGQALNLIKKPGGVVNAHEGSTVTYRSEE